MEAFAVTACPWHRLPDPVDGSEKAIPTCFRTVRGSGVREACMSRPL